MIVRSIWQVTTAATTRPRAEARDTGGWTRGARQPRDHETQTALYRPRAHVPFWLADRRRAKWTRPRDRESRLSARSHSRTEPIPNPEIAAVTLRQRQRDYRCK